MMLKAQYPYRERKIPLYKMLPIYAVGCGLFWMAVYKMAMWMVR